jgi:hypothetical protein
MTIWDERKLAKSMRIAAKELRLLKEDAQRLSEKLSAVEDAPETVESLLK